MKKIKAGVIGAGFIGAAHVEALRRLNFVSVEAIADDASVIAEKAALLGLDKYYQDYTQLLADPEIDCVHICTPNYLHYQMSKEALLAGKHVVCEKPLTTCKTEAEELVALAREKGLVHATNFNVRFYPLMHELNTVIRNGKLGDIFSVHGSYLQDWLFHPTDYNWRLEPELSGNSRAVADIGSHWMDLTEFVTGLKITEVMADFATFHPIRKKPLKPVETYTGKLLTPDDYKEIPVSTEDFASILIRFENAARGALTVSQVFAGKKNCITLEIAGSKQSASWMSEGPNELWLGNRDSANSLLMKDPSLMGSESRQLVSFPGGHNEGFPDTFKQIFLKIYRKIAGLTDKVEYPTFEAGLREIVLCEKIVESHQKGTWIKI
ncbi:MAG: Gfo/Idh/MocA family oxidoreductase [Prolixibacteraceae bacterium]